MASVTSTGILSNGDMKAGMETTRAEGGSEWRRVRGYLGEHVITDWIGDDPRYAERQEAAQRRLFGELRFTNEPSPRSRS